jgi:hypothetical protein
MGARRRAACNKSASVLSLFFDSAMNCISIIPLKYNSLWIELSAPRTSFYNNQARVENSGFLYPGCLFLYGSGRECAVAHPPTGAAVRLSFAERRSDESFLLLSAAGVSSAAELLRPAECRGRGVEEGKSAPGDAVVQRGGA